MIKIFGLILFWSVLFFPDPHPGYAAAVPRTILILHDSSEDYNRRDRDRFVPKRAEMVLNHLGLKVRYHDIQNGLPPGDKTGNIYGILTWFRDHEMPHAEDYCRWAVRQIEAGRKFVILGGLGAFVDSSTGKQIPPGLAKSVFYALGLEYRGKWTDNPLLIQMVDKEPSMVEFERTLEGEISVYEQVVPLEADTRTYLRLARTDQSGSASSVIVATSKGGYAMGHYAFFINYTDDRMQWRLNPFRFFEEAYDLGGRPKIDTTTLFGRRIFYTHIDGDGFRNVSEMDPKVFSSEVIRDEILEKFKLPFTVSFVAAEIDPGYLGSKKTVAVAKSIARMPHVEIGAHGFTHPLDWENQITVFAVRNYSKRVNIEQNPDLFSENVYTQGAVVTVDRESYLKREIRGAVDYINGHLLPEGKQVVLNQWTGNCRPPARAIEMTGELGIGNINGGDSRFDRRWPSYTGIAPLARHPQGKVQVHTSNANENIYTNGWDGSFDGLRFVIETYRQSENPTLIRRPPRRVLPLNLYYHFYSGEKRSSLEALRDVYTWVLSRPIIPVFTSEYISVVEGFFSASVERTGRESWKVSDYGAARTVRFDYEEQWPDLDRSEGVLGFSKWNDYLYVHLEKDGPAVLSLTPERPRKPYLKEASAYVDELDLNPESIDFKTRGVRESVYIFANMRKDGIYEARLTGSGEDKKIKHRRRFKAGEKGNLEIELPVNGEVKVEVRLT